MNLQAVESMAIIGNNAIWLVMDGKRHHIPNEATFNLLYDLHPQFAYPIEGWDQIPQGKPLPVGSIYIQPEGEPVYLIMTDENSGALMKRPIADPYTFNRLGFQTKKLFHVPQVPNAPFTENWTISSLKALPTGTVYQVSPSQSYVLSAIKEEEKKATPQERKKKFPWKKIGDLVVSFLLDIEWK